VNKKINLFNNLQRSLQKRIFLYKDEYFRQRSSVGSKILPQISSLYKITFYVTECHIVPYNAIFIYFTNDGFFHSQPEEGQDGAKNAN
jgi:hypothetical protein